jgi:hypothetical protein
MTIEKKRFMNESHFQIRPRGSDQWNIQEQQWMPGETLASGDFFNGSPKKDSAACDRELLDDCFCSCRTQPGFVYALVKPLGVSFMLPLLRWSPGLAARESTPLA